MTELKFLKKKSLQAGNNLCYGSKNQKVFSEFFISDTCVDNFGCCGAFQTAADTCNQSVDNCCAYVFCVESDC